MSNLSNHNMTKELIVNVERFAGLNICGFSPMNFLQEHFHSALARIA